MRYRSLKKLNLTRRLALTTMGVLAIILPIVIGFMNTPQTQAQTGTTARAFEEASVILSAAGQHEESWSEPPLCAPDSEFVCGVFSVKNVSLLNLIRFAYGAQGYQLSGMVPDSKRYDIIAKVPPNTLQEHLGAMLQTLLADRFNLKVHLETRNLPVYALVVAGGGAKFHGAEPGVDDTINAERDGIQSRQLTMSQLAGYLSGDAPEAAIGRPVLDKTAFVDSLISPCTGHPRVGRSGGSITDPN